MKKFIIAAAITLTASLSFITYQNNAVARTNAHAEKLISNNDQADFAPAHSNRMDIGQADIK
ncbi:hypothetical protein [Mucilaginibacter ginkgonis]|uniref:Uncharacterized protein n=1 Tax=Mucilaginibacter ginkgonis TaxID=2682091 RepID=A0A6I4I6C4_9SPHI|nr:hypothetical protein [Mucilaginibacter ginkgonis]QQL50668.1 hypothetical protein GO620_004200 [Mucilaginibacter ginkgonis]